MEFGAGTGKLAAGLLNARWLHSAPSSTAIRSSIFRGELRERQRETIEAVAPALAAKVRWLDALPGALRRRGDRQRGAGRDAGAALASVDGAWRERGVVWRDGWFAFEDREVSASADTALLSEIDDRRRRLRGGRRATPLVPSRGPSARCSRAARRFSSTMAFPRHEYYHAQRAQGTLMCHYRHRAHGDPFVYPGLQDITAHVEFTGIAEAGVETGADLLGFTSQARFLLNAGITDALSEIDPPTARFRPRRMRFRSCCRRPRCGELFKVIAFSRGLEDTLQAFASGDRSHTL